MKTLKLKRVASLAMACVLALSLAVPAFADTVITGQYEEPDIQVTASPSADAVINPYGLPYELGEEEISGQQIVTKSALSLQNKSKFAVDVAAELTLKPTGNDIYFCSDLDAASAKEVTTIRGLKVSLEVFKDETLTEDTLADGINAVFVALKSEDAAFTVTPGKALADGGDLVTKDGETKAEGGGDGKVVLKEAAGDGKAQANGIALFRLAGFATQSDLWVEDEADGDGFQATIVWTFTPSVP